MGPNSAPDWQDDRAWSGWWQAVAAAFLFVIVFATYGPITQAGYIWDDDEYVTNNSTLRTVDGLRRIWFEIGAVPQYYPLVHSTFWVEYQLWGLAPLGYHLVNVLLHALGVLFFWRLLLRLEVPGAWLAAALFAAHPVAVESVAWVTERKNVLSLVLALGAMLSFLRFAPATPRDAEDQAHRDPGRWWWYACSLLLFAAALASKTVVASTPAVLLVIYWWKNGRLVWRRIAALLPFFVVGAAMGILTASMEVWRVGATGKEWAFTPIDRVLIAGRALWFYAAKLAWPHPLVFFYQRWQIDSRAWWQYIFPAAACGAIVALWLLRSRVGRGPLAAVLIFAGVLMPALGFLNVYPMRYSFVADHFQHHACLALLALVAAGVTLLARRLPASGRVAAMGTAAAVLVLLAVTAGQRTTVYYDPEALYRDTIAHNPRCAAAYSNLGTYLDSVGRYDESVALSREALGHFADDVAILNNMAAALLRIGDRDGFAPGTLDEIVTYLEKSLQLQPDRVGTLTNLGFALDTANRPDEAAEYFSRALEADPYNAETLYGLGKLTARQGRAAEAESYYLRSIEQNPSLAPPHYGLALIRLAEQRPQDAIPHLQAALRIDDNLPDAHYALATALAGMGQFAPAAEHYSSALRLRPGFVRAQNNLGVALMNSGKIDEAIEHFEAAARTDPTYADAQKNLQNARLVQQRTREQQSKGQPASDK